MADVVDGNRRHSCDSAEVPEMTRRNLFRGLQKNGTAAVTSTGAGSFMAVAISAVAASAMSANTAEAEPRSVSADVDKNALLAKLVRRITWGFTQEEYALAQQLGYDGYLEYHLNPAAINDSVMDARLAAYTTLNLQPYQLYALPATQVTSELSEAMILRAIYSKRQLYERMVEFWSDHFSIDIDVDLCFYLKTPDERNVIRPNALGNFPAMLRASSQSPCMLQYLNNSTNLSGSPNENYARELMELHTLSASGPYTQTDVQEVARCFTGCTFNMRSTTNPVSGLFLFEAVYHDDGPKTVLGTHIPAGGGVQDGLTVVDILAAHPSTANFIATKLCRKFLGQDVRQSVINSVAATYIATGGDIKAMLRTVLQPGNLATDFGPRFKRPQHMMISALRVLPTPITNTQLLRITHLNGAGHIPYNWGPPDGYPDLLSHWNGLMLPRWNFAALLTTNGIPGITFDVAAYFAGLTTAQQMADKMDSTLFGNELPAAEKTILLQYIAANPADVARQRDTVGLALSCPSFHWY